MTLALWSFANTSNVAARIKYTPRISIITKKIAHTALTKSRARTRDVISSFPQLNAAHEMQRRRDAVADHAKNSCYRNPDNPKCKFCEEMLPPTDMDHHEYHCKENPEYEQRLHEAQEAD